MLFRTRYNVLFRQFRLLTAQAGSIPAAIRLIFENCYNNDNARVYRREHPLILECKLWPSRAFFIWFLDSGSVKDSLQCFYHLRENFFLCLVAINQQLIDTYCVVKGKFILLFTKNFQEKFSEWVAKSPLIEYNKSEPKAPCSGT